MKEKFLTYVFVNFKEARKVVRAMEVLINVFGYASVADLNDLFGGTSTYSEHSYGWTSLSGTTTTEVVHGGITRVEFPLPEPLKKECKSCKECTDDICMEDTVAAYCKADCVSTQNIILTKDKMDLESELEKVKKELEEAQVLTTVLKKEIEYLKWEKTWYEANYTEAKKNINELQEKLDNTTRSYSCVANNLYKKKNQFKEAMRLLKNAEFYMNSGQDIHSMYPQWVKGYYSTVNNIKEFINKKEE